MQQFHGTLTDQDVKRHLPHEFMVPPNCRQLALRLDYAPARVDGIRNMITFTLFDPNGFRGAGHRQGNRHEVQLTATLATPGYLAGPLPAGRWVAQLDTHMIRPGPACDYHLEIETVCGDDPLLPPLAGLTDTARVGDLPTFDRIANPNPGWYRGDLHTHTLHSDAAWDVGDLVNGARQIGLDFVALTDHNTTSSLAAIAAHGTPDLLTLGGMELTTFWGHAVCLGTSSWIDWRVDPLGDQMAAIATEQSSRGGLFIIAHPNDQGDPRCTGCRWIYPAMRPGPAKLVEVWNEEWGIPDPAGKNEGSLALWYRWLNAGHRLFATSGSDTHGPAGFRKAGFNVVYAEQLSQTAILAGIAAGRHYLSSGPTLTFAARQPGRPDVGMGGTLAAAGPVELGVTWQAAPAGATLRLIRNGSVVESQPIGTTGEKVWSLDAAAGQWLVVELRDATGAMSALTNPIFAG